MSRPPNELNSQRFRINMKIVLLIALSSVITIEVRGGEIVGGKTTVEIKEMIEEVEDKLKQNIHQLKDESLK